jgi:hypothetical protein
MIFFLPICQGLYLMREAIGLMREAIRGHDLLLPICHMLYLMREALTLRGQSSSQSEGNHHHNQRAIIIRLREIIIRSSEIVPLSSLRIDRISSRHVEQPARHELEDQLGLAQPRHT